MHEVVVQCDPTIDRASAGGSDERFDQLRSDLAGVKTGVQESVRAARRDPTQAMTVVAGNVSEVSMANTTSLQDTIREGQDDDRRIEIEKALDAGKPYGALYLPDVRRSARGSCGGSINTIHNVVASGESPRTRERGSSPPETSSSRRGTAKKAFQLYGEAYRAAVAIGAEGS